MGGLEIAGAIIVTGLVFLVLRNADVPFGHAVVLIAIVASLIWMFYLRHTRNNPSHAGKRTLEWGQQLQDWASDEKAEEAVNALDAIGPPAFAALSLAIEHNNAKVARKAMDTIANICSQYEVFEYRHQVVFKYVLKVFRESRDESVREHIAQGLPKCGVLANHEAVLNALRESSTADSSEAVRIASVDALNEIHLMKQPETDPAIGRARSVTRKIPAWVSIPMGMLAGLIGAFVALLVVDNRREIPAKILDPNCHDRKIFGRFVGSLHVTFAFAGSLMGALFTLTQLPQEKDPLFWMVMWVVVLPSFGCGLFGSIKLIRTRIQAWPLD